MELHFSTALVPNLSPSMFHPPNGGILRASDEHAMWQEDEK
jgi:hypothetical protein